MRLSSDNLTDFQHELKRAVGDQYVLTQDDDIHPYLEDWRGYEKGQASAVVFPANTSEVASIMQIAARHGVSIVPQGGNTGLCQGAVPIGAANCIVVVLRRMQKIREVDKPSSVLVLDAGVTLAMAHIEADKIERRVPLHLGSEGSAQIGGLVSTNAGGTSALRYGPVRELVCGVEVVLPNGEIFSDLKALRKDNTGYDLRNLFIGAEGTLGIVTAVALRMHPKIRNSAHAWLALPDLNAAISVLTQLQDQFDTSVQAVELLSGNEVDLVLKHIPRARQPFEATPDWSLLIELGNTDQNSDLYQSLEDLLAVCLEEETVVDAFIPQSEAQAQDIWHVRHSVSEANKIEGHSLSHDVAVRPTLIPTMITRLSAIINAEFPSAQILIVSHIGDGNVHFIVHFTHEEWTALSNPKEVTERVMGLVHDEVEELGGTFSAEHGIGRKLVAELSMRTDPVRMQLMRDIKKLIDPNIQMNPGALLQV